MPIKMMKITQIFGVFSILIGMHFSGFAQNDLQGKTTQWSVSEQTDLISGNTIQNASVVEVSDSKIVWGAAIDNDAYSMTVTSISGTWEAINNTGAVTYTVEVSNGSGTVLLNGDENGLTITFDLTFENGTAYLRLKANNILYK